MNITINSPSELVIEIHDRRQCTSRSMLALTAEAAATSAPAPATASPPALEWSPTSDDTMTHAKAEEWCRNLRHDGHDDWRLPTREELQSLVDYTKHNQAIDTERFPDTKSSSYWTSSPAASDPGYAWIVSFNSGLVSLFHRGYYAWVRAVRVSRASQ